MDNYDRIAELLIAMGDFACEAQKHVVRDYKLDGTVLTKTDLFISEQVTSKIAELFPEANIVTEEALHPFHPEASLTFVLDPIDGTDVYSQGLPGWCIGLGILDSHHRCIGGMINAPRWGLSRDEGLFLRVDPGKKLLLNGIPFLADDNKDNVEQIAMASHAPRYFNLLKFTGKIRCYGSNLLHMLSTLVHSNIQGSISVPCFAWDIAAAQAILESQGLHVKYADGSPFIYDADLLQYRKPFVGLMVCGSEKAVEEIRGMLHEA
ncbi:MAG: inositol monophosphatase [Spirochaetae bacterium HGW-Spirochaetae-8]|jgi:myo-inositol-1(or 4)-monophosphatase|nr:MAG: inositol monophosphatase [Spirochaetae bacterium HGW-Spirochaetae-8]